MADVTSNLVVLWRFNNDALDSSGSTNTHNLTTSGITYINDKDSNANSAVSFDGVNDSAKLNAHADFDLPSGRDMTLSCWIYRPTAVDGRIIMARDGSSSSYPGWYIYVYSTGEIRLYISDASTVTVDFTFSDPVATGGWHHVAVTMDRSGLATYYLDGVSKDTVSISSTNGVNITNTNGNVGIGYVENTIGAGTIYHNQRLDEYRIYHRALAAADILDLYNNFEGPAEPTTTARLSKIAGIDRNTVSSASGVDTDNIKSINGII